LIKIEMWENLKNSVEKPVGVAGKRGSATNSVRTHENDLTPLINNLMRRVDPWVSWAGVARFASVTWNHSVKVMRPGDTL
jgi:hypothetical protein